MRKLIFAFLVVYGHNAFGQSNNSESNRYTSDRFSIQASLGNNFDLYQPLSDANLVLIPIRDFRSFYTEFDRFAWNLQGQVSYALNPVWNLYAGGSLGTMSGSNNTDYYRASLFSVDMGMKYNLSNIRIRPRKTRWQLLPLIGVTYNYFSSDLYYLFDETSQHTESGDVFGFNIGTELHFALHKNISVFGSFVRRGFRSDGLDGWDYGGNGDDYFRTNIGVRLKLVRSSKSEHASDVNLWEAVNNNYSQNITNNSSKSSGSKKPVFDFCTRLEMYVVGDKDDYDGRKINNPTLYVVRGETYYFKNCDELSPLRISKKKHARSRPSGLAKNGIKPEDGLVPFRIPIDAQDEYYYYSDANDSIGGIIKVLGVNEDGDINNFKKLVNNLNDEMQKLKIKIAKDSRDTTLNIINSHSQPPAQDEFDFDFKNDNYVVGDKEDYEDGKNTNPKLYVVRGASYKIKNASDDHPLRLSKSKDGREKPSGLESNGIKDDDGSVNWKIPLDAPDEYYYYSDANDSIGGVIKVLGDESDEMDLLNQRIKEINDELNKLKVAQGKTPESNSSDTTINITNVQMVAPAVDDFVFNDQDDKYVVGDDSQYEGGINENPTLYVVRGSSYNIRNNSKDQPLRVSKKDGERDDPKGLGANGITEGDGSVTWKIPFDAPNEYYYYSDADDKLRGTIKVLGESSGDTTMNITNIQTAVPSEEDDFTFGFDNDKYVVGDDSDYEDGKNENPTLYVVRGADYKIRNDSDDQPLRFSKKKGERDNPKGLDSNGITSEDGSVNWKVPLDAPEEYYYYSDASDTIGGTIKVLGGNSSDTTIYITNIQSAGDSSSDDFVFNDQDDRYVVGDDSQYEGGINENPTLYVVRGSSYNIRNNSKDQPLRVSKKDGERDDPKGLGANGITEGDGSVTWKIPFDAPNEYYYYSDADDKLRGTIKVLGESSGDTTMNITNIQTAVPSEEDDFTFGFDNDKYVVGDDSDYEDGKNENPTLYVVRGADYKIRNDSDDQPLRFSKKKGERDNPKGLDSNGITSEDGSVNWKVPLDAPEEYYYYSDASDTIGGTIKVLGGNSSDTTINITNVQMVAPAVDDFVFNDQDDRYVVGDKLDYEKGDNKNPTLYVVRGLNYKFKNNSDEHPLRISTKDGRPASPRGIVSDSITKDDGSVNWKIPLDAPDEYYYYSEANDTLRGVIKVMGGEGNTEGDVYDVDLTQDFNKLIKDLQDKMEMELSNLKSQDDVDRFEGGQHLVLFYNVDIHILTKEQKKKIFEFVYKLKKESIGFEYKMIISGFADERASAAYNDALRQRRSNEVKKFFKQLGLVVPTEDRTATHTYTGEMFLDRRVELTVEVL